jgi:rubrerythrin
LYAYVLNLAKYVARSESSKTQNYLISEVDFSIIFAYRPGLCARVNHHNRGGEQYMATAQNLQEAFAGESQANREYLAFAKKAEQDGFPQVAKLFRAAAAAETVHAHAHLRVMGGVKGTLENLQAAIEGEGLEFREMYPKFLGEAEGEGNKPAMFSFRHALAVEEIHHGLYSEALETVQSGRDLPEVKLYVCSVCGNTVQGAPLEVCPICNSPKDRFFEVQ